VVERGDVRAQALPCGPAGEQQEVALVLPDRVLGAAVGAELEQEALARGVEGLGAVAAGSAAHHRSARPRALIENVPVPRDTSTASRTTCTAGAEHTPAMRADASEP